MDIGFDRHWVGWTLDQMDIGSDGHLVGWTWTFGQMDIQTQLVLTIAIAKHGYRVGWTFG